MHCHAMKVLKRLLVAVIMLVLLAIVAGGAAIWVLTDKAKARQKEDRVVASPKTGAFVAANDARIFVQRLGPADAPAVVFIHGTGSWSETWRPSMELAVQAGYQAYAIDLPP